MSNSTIYPMTFAPLLKELVWGGDKLGRLLGKGAPTSRPIGESWELVDLPSDQSVVASGLRAGTSLHELLAHDAVSVLGPVGLDGGRFPLLVKYIDAAQTLSVQVHPDETAATALGGRPKNEVWYVLHAEPGARLYLGLRPGTTRETFERALAEGSVEGLLQEIPAAAGQMVHVSPGTVHAIGAGILLAEVQQPSDTTYRVYDWGRVGLDGKPRPLHVDQALTCIGWGNPARVRLPNAGERLDAGHFFATIHALVGGEQLRLPGQGPLVLVGLDGEAEARWGGAEPIRLVLGQVALVPHACRDAIVVGKKGARLLAVTFPVH
ncbi:MAG: class I mannose-6-phosphate isomerase [Deltaproteobacteria bacterium]|nr:class I mannose-6-phosphate isomerase [Deltaproteobacteria bacterium]